MLNHCFATHLNFLDPLLTSDGKPYGPTRFKELVKECYIIAKKCNTSYTDLLTITPTEKNYLLEFIIDDAKDAQKMVEKNRERLNNL